MLAKVRKTGVPFHASCQLAIHLRTLLRDFIVVNLHACKVFPSSSVCGTL
jgi:hypothetical protein